MESLKFMKNLQSIETERKKKMVNYYLLRNMNKLGMNG